MSHEWRMLPAWIKAIRDRGSSGDPRDPMAVVFPPEPSIEPSDWRRFKPRWTLEVSPGFRVQLHRAPGWFYRFTQRAVLGLRYTENSET